MPFSCRGQSSTSIVPEGLRNKSKQHNNLISLVHEGQPGTLQMSTNRQLILPFALPYLAYVAIASFFDGLLSIEVNYALRIAVVISLLAWSRRWYFSFKGPSAPGVSVAIGLAGGLVGAVIWISLLAPFTLHTETTPWSNTAFLLRLAAAGLLVPVFEELLMRGFVFRLALQWDQARKLGDKEPLQTALDDKSVNEVKAGEWSWMAVAISTAAFTSGHQIEEWPASIAFGLLMSFLWVYQKDLLSCVVAHAVTNIALACYVLLTGNWQFW